MPDSSPFTVTDEEFKDQIEGNRYTSAWSFGEDLDNNSDSAFLVQARNPDDGYIIIGPVRLKLAKEYMTVILYENPTVSSVGTARNSYNRRNDAPDPDSTAYTAPTYTGGDRISDYPRGFADSETQMTIPPMIVEHDTDIVFNLVKRIKKDGTIEEEKKPYGAVINWSEVENTIIPNLSV